MKEETKVLVPFNDPELVVLRNPVARARFNLSVYQMKFLLEVLAYLKNKPDERILEFNIRQFNNSLSIETNNLVFYVNEIRKMVHHVIAIPTEERKDGGIRLKEVALISGIDTDIDGRGEGYIKIEVADMIKPYFLEIANGQFFSFHKNNSRVLKSRYSINLYILLKSYQQLRFFTIKYAELRNILEIQPQEYNPFKEFKRWVLERARKEMFEKNDIYFDYEVIRLGGKQKGEVDRLVFHIKENLENKAKLKKKEERDFIQPLLFQTHPSVSGEKWEPIGRKMGTEKIDNTPISLDNKEENEIEKLYRYFDKDTPEDVLTIFIKGLNANGYNNERILDVLLYAKEVTLKGEKIRNIMSYMKKGLESGLMGRGLSKSKKEKSGIGEEHKAILELFEGNMFKNYVIQYYILKGSEADSELKKRFVELAQNQPQYAKFFDVNGKIKESQKDKFREALGRRIADNNMETVDFIFTKWVALTRGYAVEKKNGQWRKVEMDSIG
jgi:hypothetical protein